MEDAIEGTPIQEAAYKCLDLFEPFLPSERLRDTDGEDTDSPILQLIEDQYGRFNSWAENIGVFADNKASLDARLAGSSHVSKLILAQLTILANHLEQLSKDPLEDKDASFEDEGTGAPSTEDGTASAISSGDSDEETVDMDGDVPEDVRIIRGSIDRLVRLALAIRRTSAVQQNQRAANHVEYDEDGVEKVAAFGEMALRLVQTWYPKASRTVHIRLADTMKKRRRQLLYRTQHMLKLKGNPKRQSGVKRQYLAPETVRSTIQHKSTVPQSSARSVFSLRSIALTNTRSISKLSGTEASTFIAPKFDPDAPSTIASTAVSAAASHVEVIDWPSPPKTAPGAMEFVCPHCTLNTPKMEGNEEKWKQHLIKDLEPWVCLVDKCAEPHTLFRDRNSWINHMKTHASQWVCALPGHPPMRFGVEESYDQHMATTHRGFTTTQLAGLKKWNLKPSSIVFRSCPICNEEYLPEDALGPGISESTILSFQRRLQSHITRHLVKVALHCIPFRDDDEASVSSEPEESNRRVAESTVNRVPSVVYGDMDPATDVFLLEEYADILLNNPELPDCDMVSVQDWEFVRNGTKPYKGHAEDPRLQTFVRKFQIEALIAAGQASDPVLPCRLVSLNPNKDFYGREALLKKLAQKLCPDDTAGLNPGSPPPKMKTIILRGAGGIGKTQVAREFVLQNLKKFDAVFWCHADEVSKISTDFDNIAIKLGLVPDASGDSRDQSLTRQLVKGWLENPVKSYNEGQASELVSWLLILDDVSKPQVLQDFIPTGGTHGSLLITLREHMHWSIPDSESEMVQPFAPDEAAAFLSKLTRRGESSMEQQFGNAIGRRVGGSPHELTFVARIIREKNYSFEEFIEAQTARENQQAILSLNLHDLKDRLKDRVRNDQDDFMFSSWALDVLELGTGLLDVLSMFDSDGVSERLLMSWSSSDLLMEDYPKNLEDYKDARMELLDYSLITQDRSSGSLMVHRRVQDAARRRMNPDRYLEVFYTCVALLNKSYPSQPFSWRHSVMNWPQIQQLYSHILRLRDYARPIKFTTKNRANDYQYAQLCAEIAWYCHERGWSIQSEDFCNIAQAFCTITTETYQEDPSLEKEGSPSQSDLNRILADVWHTKGIAATEMNKPKQALEYLALFNNMMVKEWGSTIGGTNMRLPISWNQLGVAYMINDDWDHGIECFLKSIAAMKQLDNYQPYKISLPLANLGCAYWLTGRFDEAVQTLQEGLEYRAAEFGPDDGESFITGRFYHGLGNVRESQGLLEESFFYHEKARDHYRRTIGRQHHRTADANIRLADHFIRRNTETDLKHARELLDQALKAYGDLDLYFPEKARALYKRSQIWQRMDKPHDAHCDSNECLRLYRIFRPLDNRPLEELSPKDLDKIIVFWSR